MNAKVQIHDWYKQYQQLKAQSADAILFYRLGDFYETFDDDAKLVAEVLEVTLTRKDYAVAKVKGSEKLYCPMAGIPYHAVESYVARLVNLGYRVAIAEQISETASTKTDTRPRSVFDVGDKTIGQQRGVAHREIVRVITPGTVTDPVMLTAVKNNYLAAVIAEKEQIGLAFVDLSTGEFAATEFTGERAATQLEGELARLQVSEVLVPDSEALRLPHIAPTTAHLAQDLAPMTKEERSTLLPHERVARRLEQESSARWIQGNVTALPSWRWELATARDALLQQLGVQNLTGFGLDDKPFATQAAGAILQYVLETQKSQVAQITTLHVYTTSEFMFLDPQTRRNLELLESSSGKAKSSLIGVLDQTKTPMGARLLRKWLSQPLLNLEILQTRQEAVALCANDGLLRAELRQALAGVGDMERSVNRVLQGANTATPRDLVQLRQALRILPEVAKTVEKVLFTTFTPEATLPPAQKTVQKAKVEDDNDLFADDEVESANNQENDQEIDLFDHCALALDFLEKALDDEPPALLGASNYLRAEDGSGKARLVIRPGFDEKMDEVVSASRDAQDWINNLEAQEREKTGIKALKVDYNKVFGYYIEVSRNASGQVPRHYERKQTLVSAERYITAELKEYEIIVLNAQQRLVELERDAFGRICREIAKYGPQLRTMAQNLAQIDVFQALAEVAVRGRYVRPKLNESTNLYISGGRHPVVEQALGDIFVPNDIQTNTEDQQLLIITGANAAGKSTVLRQVALIVLLAQIGSFVPANEAEIGLVDRIFTRIGAQDDIATGRSTFMVEMTETAALLVQSSRRSLIILDEVGRGTSTYDGMAIARAVVEYIHNEPRLQCKTLFATHYHELTALEEILPRIRNYHMAAVEQEGKVLFLYELRRGGADKSYGIHVAELAGIPRAVIRRATELLAELEGKDREKLAKKEISQADSVESSEENTPQPQISFADTISNPVLEYLRRLNIHELTPIEAMTKLYELQKLARDVV